MSDLTDAIERYAAFGDCTSADERTLLAAARRVAQAPQIAWCDIHNAVFRFEDQCDGAEVLHLEPHCRMVRKLLVDPAEET